MNILVCVKQVPDTTEIKIDPVTNTLIRDGVPSIVNPFDGYALEVAVRLKEQVGGCVTVLSMGPPQAMVALRECLSVGADKAFLVSGRAFGGSDTLATSYIISAAVKAVEKELGEKFDLILCGKQAIDGDTGQVGPEMAEHLGYPQITYVSEAEIVGDSVRVKRVTDEGYDIIEAKLPALLTVVKTVFEPRYATIKSKLAANKAVIPVLSDADFEIDLSRAGLKGSPTKVKKTFTPQNKKEGIIIHEETGADSAAKLVGMLSAAHLV